MNSGGRGAAKREGGGRFFVEKNALHTFSREKKRTELENGGLIKEKKKG